MNLQPDEVDELLYACRLGFTVPKGKRKEFAEIVDHEDKYVRKAKAAINALRRRDRQIEALNIMDLIAEYPEAWNLVRKHLKELKEPAE